VESAPSWYGDIRNLQTEKKSAQVAPDALEESPARALSGDKPK
jgi:hypothetical protein